MVIKILFDGQCGSIPFNSCSCTSFFLFNLTDKREYVQLNFSYKLWESVFGPVKIKNWDNWIYPTYSKCFLHYYCGNASLIADNLSLINIKLQTVWHLIINWCHHFSRQPPYSDESVNKTPNNLSLRIIHKS